MSEPQHTFREDLELMRHVLSSETIAHLAADFDAAVAEARQQGRDMDVAYAAGIEEGRHLERDEIRAELFPLPIGDNVDYGRGQEDVRAFVLSLLADKAALVDALREAERRMGLYWSDDGDAGNEEELAAADDVIRAALREHSDGE
jgi:hypothetical protein